MKSATRPRDAVWDALIAIFPAPTNDAERGRLNQAVKLLKQSGATPQAIHAKVAAYKRTFPRAVCTPMAIANNWAMLAPAKTTQPELPKPPTAEEAAWLIQRLIQQAANTAAPQHRRAEDFDYLMDYIDRLPAAVRSDPRVVAVLPKSKEVA